MKSAWVVGRCKIEVREEEYIQPGPEEVVVKIRTCGICGTDLHFYRDLPGDVPLPLGHEVAGTVHETGEAVSDLGVGQSVIVQNHIPCGTCSPCLMGKPAQCWNIETYMNDRAGMAEFLRLGRKMVVSYSGLQFEEAALAEPLTVAFDLMREAKIEPFQNVCVSGPGIIGLFCTRLASKLGARNVIVLGRAFQSERGKCRIEAAKRMGASRVFDTDQDAWKEEVKKEVPEGFEKIIITSPPRTIPETFELASFGGDIVFNGISFQEEEITFNANTFHFKKLSLFASHAMPNWGFPLAFTLLEEKKLGHESLITHRFPFEKIEEAFTTATSRDHGVIKVMVTFE